VGQPVVEVGIGSALRDTLELVVHSAPIGIGQEQAVQELLFGRGYAGQHLLKVAGIDDGAHPARQLVQRTEGREFGMLLDQLLDRHIDEVGAVVHHLGGAMDSHGATM
jgi:hypothetical protein